MKTHMEIPWLDTEQFGFPSLENALEEPNGLLAVGGDLSSQRLMHAYQAGIFPWYEEGQPLLWWSPDPRCVLFPSRVHLSRSLRKLLRSNDFDIRCDTAFSAVVEQCSAPRSYTDGTWITAAMKEAYTKLHEEGVAHSIEVWQNDQLQGGLYGLAIGRVFFGESMFSRVANASKLALASLCGQLEQWEYQLIDCQVENPHLMSMGAEMLPRQQFAEYLSRFATGGGQEQPWQISWSYS